MFYREAGQFKTSYASDQAMFPILQDAIGIVVIWLVAFIVVPLTDNDFLINAVMIPFLIFSLAAIGLNLLTGYTGLLSLGTGAFMGVGAYRLLQAHDDLSRRQHHRLDHLLRASSRPRSARVRPAVAAHQGLLSRGRDAGRAVLPGMVLHPHPVALQLQHLRRRSKCRSASCSASSSPGRAPPPRRAIYIVLAIVVVMTWLASNLMHGRIGRTWMAVRDMDIAAELMGIKLLPTKLLAFAVSSFYCGVAGAMLVFLWYGGAESDSLQHQPELHDPVHDHHRRPRQPARLVPRRGADLHPADRLRFVPECSGCRLHAATVEHITFMIVGALIIFFLIAEPAGLARLWQIGKQKLRVWPFPY